MKRFSPPFLAMLTCLLLLTACGRPAIYPPGHNYNTVPSTQRPYVIKGRTYYPLPSAQGFVETGVASWYGGKFHGRKTACGERYNMYAKTAAHKTLPLQTMVLVENLENGREMVVRINDRGPFARGRIIDLSLTAARELDVVRKGTARVRISALGEAVSYQASNTNYHRFLPHDDFNAGEFYVQIGSFTNRANADRLKNKMIGRGRKTVVRSFNNGQTIFYRVHVQAGNNLVAAKHQEQVLAASGFPGFVVAR